MKVKLLGVVGSALLLLNPVAGVLAQVAPTNSVSAENNWDYDTANSGLGEYDKLLQNAGPNDGQVDWYPTKSSLSSQPTAQELVHQLISLSIATNQANSQVRTALFNNTNGSNQKYDEERQPYALAFSFIAQLLDFNNEKTGNGAYLQQHAVADEVNDPIDSQSNDVINREVQTEPAKGKGRNIADILGKAFFGNPDEAFAQIYLNGYDNTAQNAANIIRESTTSITIVAQSKLTGRKASAIFKLNNKTLPYQIRDSVLNNNIDGGIKATDSSYKTNGAQVANAEDWVTNANYSNKPTFWVDGSGKGTLVVPRGTTARQIAQMIAKLKIDSNYQMKTVAPMKAIQGNFAKGPGAPWLPQSKFNATDASVSYNHAFIPNSNGVEDGSATAAWNSQKLPNGDNAFIGIDPVNANEVNNEFAKGTAGKVTGSTSDYKGTVNKQAWFSNALDTNQYPEIQYSAKTSAFKIPNFEASEGSPSFKVTQNVTRDGGSNWLDSAKQNSASNIGKVTHLFDPTRDQDANGNSMLREAWDAQHYAYALPQLKQFANNQTSEAQIEQLAQEISNNGSFQSAGANSAIKKSFTYEAPVDAWVFKSYVNPYSTVMSSEGAKQPMTYEKTDSNNPNAVDGSDRSQARGKWQSIVGGTPYWDKGNLLKDAKSEVTAVQVEPKALAGYLSSKPTGSELVDITRGTRTISLIIDQEQSPNYKFDNLQVGSTTSYGDVKFDNTSGGTIKVANTDIGEFDIKIPYGITTWARQGAVGVNQLYTNISDELGCNDSSNNGTLAIKGLNVSQLLTSSGIFDVVDPTPSLTGNPSIQIADNHLNFVETFNTNTGFNGASSYPQKLAASPVDETNIAGINFPNFKSMYKFSGVFALLKYNNKASFDGNTDGSLIEIGDEINWTDNNGNPQSIKIQNNATGGLSQGEVVPTNTSYTVKRHPEATGGHSVPFIKMTFGETITQTNASKVAFFDSNLYNPHGDSSNLPEDNYVSQDYSIGPAKLDSVSRNDYSDNGRYIGFKENGELDSSRTTAEDVVDSVAKRNRILGNSDSANKINDSNVNEGQNPNYKMVNLQDLDQPNTVYSGVTKAMKELYGISEGKFLKASLPQKQVNAGTARINVVVYDQDKTAISTPAKAETKPSFSTTDVSTGNDPFNVNLRPYTTTYDDGTVLKGADVPQSFKNLLSNTLVAGNADLVDHPNRLEQVLVSAFLNSWQQNDGSFNQTDTGVGVNSPLYLYGGFGISNSDTKNSYSQWPNGYTTNTGDYLTATSHYSGDFYRGGKDLQLVRGGTVKGIPASALKADVSKVDLSKAGTYPVVYTYTNPNNTKDSASITVPVTVKDAAAPVFAFQGGNDVTLHVGEPFDRTAYKVVGNWQIFNKSEGDYNKLVSGEGITKNSKGEPDVTISGDVDTNTPGVYQVTYEATNLSGIKAKMVRKINVLPKSTGPDQSDWTVSVMKGVGYINYTPGYGINVWNAPAGTFTGQRLNHGTSWKIFQKAVNRQGKVYYNVGKNQWLDGQYVSFTPVSTMQPLNGVVTINYVRGYGVNLWKAPKTTGGYHEGRKLPHGTQWKVFGIQDGFYKVGGNQWIQAKYAKFQAR